MPGGYLKIKSKNFRENAILSSISELKMALERQRKIPQA